MKYLFISLMFLCGCASLESNNEQIDLDIEATDTAGSMSEELTLDSESQLSLDENELEGLKFESKRQTKPYYTLQVGAYPTRKMASLIAAKMNIKEYPILFEKAEIKGKTWQRVCIGKFKSKKSAMDFQKSLSGDSFVRTIEVVK